MGKPPPNPHYVFYHSFGLTLKNASDPEEFVTDCPFCGAERHLFISRTTGLYGCLVCPKKGNHYTFLGDLYEESLKLTKPADYENLSRNRGLTKKTLEVAGLARSILKPGVWLLPSRNEQGAITNLYQAIPTEESQHVAQTSLPGKLQHGSRKSTQSPPPRSSFSPGRVHGKSGGQNPLPPRRKTPPPRRDGQPGNGVPLHGTAESLCKYELRSAPTPCVQQLLGAEYLDSQKNVILVEGHWDRLAVWETLASLEVVKKGTGNFFTWEVRPLRGIPNYFSELLSEVAVLGVPGANIFKSEWAKKLRGRHLILLYDNDNDRVICPKCRGTEGYKAHPVNTSCPKCQGAETTGVVINPGRDGVEKVAKEIDDLGVDLLSLNRIVWREGDPKDIRDVLRM